MQDLNAHSCLMGLEIGKMLCAKPRVSVNMRARCHKHAVTMLTRPGQVDEQLKESSRVKRRKIGTAFRKLSKVYSNFSAKALLFVRASKMRSQISSSSFFAELKTMKCFKSGL